MNQLLSTIESLLFVANKPLSAKIIAKNLKNSEEQIVTALHELQTIHATSGIVLLEASDGWQFSTNAQNSEAVKTFLNTEIREKLTDATVETLAIIAYRQPISKAEIEAIRGVNCQYSIRHLQIRGLIQKVSNPKDLRQPLYATTIEFLQHMGIQTTNELPEFDAMVEKITLPDLETNSESMNTPQAT